VAPVEDAGEIPTASLPAVASALQFDLKEFAAEPEVTPSSSADDVAELRREVERLRTENEEAQAQTQALLREIRLLLSQSRFA
jgi:hypothetical protein